MTGNKRDPWDETNFPNDQLTDLVLHKDDEPVMQDGGITNEPEYVEQKTSEAPDVEVFPLQENDDSTCWFPIHFAYQDIDHTADVQRTQTPLAEYHISGVTPAMEHLPDPFVVAEHFSKEKFDFPVNETYYPLAFGNAIIRAINHGNNNGFSLLEKEGSDSAG